jgi:hypothetical protein
VLAGAAMNDKGEWQEINGNQYMQRHLYDMTWGDIDLSKHVVACCPFGGPVALIRDTRKLTRVGLDEEMKRPLLRIFNAAGGALAEVPWERKGLVRMAWTASETLVAGGWFGCALVRASEWAKERERARARSRVCAAKIRSGASLTRRLVRARDSQCSTTAPWRSTLSAATR